MINTSDYSFFLTFKNFLFQARNRTNAWSAARRSPRAAIWSRTCASTQATNRSNAASATRRSRGRSIFDGTERDSIRQHPPLTIAPSNYPRSPPTSDTLHPYSLPPLITWYLSPATVEILCRVDRIHSNGISLESPSVTVCFFSLFVSVYHWEEVWSRKWWIVGKWSRWVRNRFLERKTRNEYANVGLKLRMMGRWWYTCLLTVQWRLDTKEGSIYWIRFNELLNIRVIFNFKRLHCEN